MRDRSPEINQAEFGYVPDLNQFVQLHLDENEKYISLAFYTVMNVTVHVAASQQCQSL